MKGQPPDAEDLILQASSLSAKQWSTLATELIYTHNYNGWVRLTGPCDDAYLMILHRHTHTHTDTHTDTHTHDNQKNKQNIIIVLLL